MNTITEKLKLKKANCILSIIENAQERIETCKWQIRTKNIFYPQIYWEKQIETHQNAISRLENSYQNLLNN